jgi:Holliday junction resolvase-like predicted endonuclease
MMNRKVSRIIAYPLLSFAVMLVALQAGEIPLATATPQDKPVEEVQKNIQVLKGLPSSQLLPVMHFMRASLGVRCEYCHVAENGKYDRDDKPAKQTARRMLQMVFDLNKANFGGQPVVTCNTCHRGSTKPVAIPAIGQGAFANTTRADAPEPTAVPLPSVDQIFDKYLSAIGGRAAFEKIQSRVSRLTLLRPKLVNSGTPKAAMLNRGETWTAEILQKAPDKFLSVVTRPDGVVYQGTDGVTGWMKSKDEKRALNESETARLKQQGSLLRETNLKSQYGELRVVAREKLNDRDVYLVEGRNTSNRLERLLFDVNRSFLLRRTVLAEIKLGLDPEQTDFEDYREVNGVWLPFTVRTSFLDDNHYGTTRMILELKQNVPIDDARFAAPPP